MSALTIAAIVGRLLLAMLFVLAGAAKIVGPAPFLAHMDAFKVPRILLPLVIVVEIGGGIGLLIGWRLPIFAGMLAMFCALTAVVFHRQLGDRVERTQFFKDVALAGALTVIAVGAVAAMSSGASA
jgi:putative oxidoreductase